MRDALRSALLLLLITVGSGVAATANPQENSVFDSNPIAFLLLGTTFGALGLIKRPRK